MLTIVSSQVLSIQSKGFCKPLQNLLYGLGSALSMGAFPHWKSPLGEPTSQTIERFSKND
jgi:hypothetical protein